MPIISIFSGSFCGGDTVAENVASRMGYERIDGQVMEQAATNSGIPEEKLRRAMSGPPPFFNRLTCERERAVAHVRQALAELIEADNVVHHGLARHLIPTNITHTLQICLIASLPHRIAQATSETELTVKQAKRIIKEGDNERSRWTHYLIGTDPYDQDLYDIVFPMHLTNVGESVKRICHHARQLAVQVECPHRPA